MFVGNLSFDTTRDQLFAHLTEAGEIVDVFIPTDRATGKPRGFAFVEFATADEAAAAIQRFDGSELGGRNLRINMADDRPPRPSFGGGFPPSGGPPPRGAGGKNKGSRRGLRAKKRSL